MINQVAGRMTAHDMAKVRRDQAKTGMAVALGALVGTGVLIAMAGPEQKRGARLLHLCAGAAMLGLTCWHVGMYHKHGKGS